MTGAYESWKLQREKLGGELRTLEDGAACTQRVLHALRQVEQDVMAAQESDVLRQQAGVLFSCVKGSLKLLGVPVETRRWVAQSFAKPVKKRPGTQLLPLISILLQVLAGLYGYWKKLDLVWLLAAASAVLTACGLIVRGKQPAPAPESDVRVTVRPDVNQLLEIMDGQMQALDRYLTDLDYLNEACSSHAGTADEHAAGLAAGVLEAIYADGEPQDDLLEAVERMLAGMGLCAVSYSDGERALFSVLPSKTMTRTLSPALVRQSDRRLLRRGTAVVCDTKE